MDARGGGGGEGGGGARAPPPLLACLVPHPPSSLPSFAAINAGVAGCATGLAMGWSGGPAAALQNCAVFGGFSLVLDRLQGGGGGGVGKAGAAGEEMVPEAGGRRTVGPRRAARRAGGRAGGAEGRPRARGCGPAGYCPACPPLAAALGALPPGVVQFLVKRPDLVLRA